MYFRGSCSLERWQLATIRDGGGVGENASSFLDSVFINHWKVRWEVKPEGERVVLERHARCDAAPTMPRAAPQGRLRRFPVGPVLAFLSRVSTAIRVDASACVLSDPTTYLPRGILAAMNMVDFGFVPILYL